MEAKSIKSAAFHGVMANTEKLIQWILNHRQFEPRFERLLWIDELLPGEFDYACTLNLGSKCFIGWGSASEEETALAKAVAEALERCVVHFLELKNSNGVAAHFHANAARINARSELIERDLFLCHFYSQTPFSPISATENELLPFRKYFATKGIRVRHFSLGIDRGVVCVLDGRWSANPFGFVISSAYKQSLSDSILAASIEGGRRLNFYLCNPEICQSLNLQKFLNQERWTFRDHGLLALDLAYANSIAHLFPDLLNNKIRYARTLPNDTITEETLSNVSSLFEGCPLHFVRSFSDSAFGMFAGPPALQEESLQRLSCFLGREISRSELNPLPHPFD